MLTAECYMLRAGRIPNPSLKNAGIEARRNGHAQLLATVHKIIAKFARADHRGLHPLPLQSGHDTLDTALGPGTIVASTNKARIGQSRRFLEATVVHSVEEILQGTAHGAKIFGCTQDHGMRPKHIVRNSVEGAQRPQLDRLELAHRGAADDGIRQSAGILGRCMRHHQKMLSHNWVASHPADGHTRTRSAARSPTTCAMKIASSFKTHLATTLQRLGPLVVLAGLMMLVVAACSPGYSPAKAPEPDIDAILTAPQYAEVQITHKPDLSRSLATTATIGTIIMEYLVDDQLVGSHWVHRGFDEVINVVGGNHELVVQQCYRGLATLGGRNCQYIKYHFRVRPGERGHVNVLQPNVLRPKTGGFLQWHELEVSRD